LDRVGSLRAILQDVGDQTGTTISVEPPLADGMIFVKVRDLPAQELLDRLASKLQATWSKSSPTRMGLERTAAQRSAVFSSHARTLEQVLPTAIGDGSAEWQSDDLDQAASRYAAKIRAAMDDPTKQTAVVTGPADGLLRELVKDIGWATLARIPAYRIALYSNEPTASERPLPDKCDLAIKRYRQIELKMAALIDELMRERWDQYTGDRVIAPLHQAGAIGRVLLSAYRTDTNAFFNLTVYRLDGTRHSWASKQATFTLPNPPTVKLSTDETALRWGLQETIDALKSNAQVPLAERTASPEDFDLLELQAAPGLRAISGKQSCLVFLPDRIVQLLLERQPKSGKSFSDALRQCGVALSEDDGWLSGSPVDLSVYDRSCLSRNYLSDWVKGLRKDPDDQVRASALLYAKAGDSVATSDLDDLYRNKVLPRFGVPAHPMRLPRWLLAFLGALSDQEWSSLMGGEPVSVGSGSRSASMHTWSYSAAQALSRLAGGGNIPDSMLCGSLAFPNGLPPGAVVRIHPRSAFYLQIPDGERMNLASLADLVSSKMQTGSVEEIPRLVTGAYDVLTRGVSRFEALFSPELAMSAEQETGKFTSIAKAASYGEWPAAVRTEFERVVLEYWRLRRPNQVSKPPPW